MSCSVRRPNGSAPGRRGAASEASGGGGGGTKKRFASGRSPTREPYNLPPAKLSFMGGGNYFRNDG